MKLFPTNLIGDYLKTYFTENEFLYTSPNLKINPDEELHNYLNDMKMKKNK